LQVLYFYEFENFDFPPKMGDFGGNSKILNVKPHRVTPHFKGLDLRKQTAQIRGLYLNPVKNGGQLKFKKKATSKFTHTASYFKCHPFSLFIVD
jgi:hypothetical protein